MVNWYLQCLSSSVAATNSSVVEVLEKHPETN